MSQREEMQDTTNNIIIQHPKSKSAIKEKIAPKFEEPKKLDPLLYKPSEIEFNTRDYDIYDPGAHKGEVLLSESNKYLVPFRNIAKKTQPVIKSPLDTIKRPKLLEPSNFGRKKPLSDLAPLVNSLQIARREQEIERDTLNFKEDPVAYFSKRKDGSGHLFIYMVYARDRKDPYFSPYELVKVTSSEIGKDYFTMTASGVTHVMANGDTETYALDLWSREKFIYSGMRKLKFFSKYFIWKCMHNWRLFLKERRFKKLFNEAMSHTIISNSILFKTNLDMNQSQNQIIDLVKKFLLCFPIGRKFRIQDFEEQNIENTTKLKKEYLVFMSKNTEMITELFKNIADPLAVQVTDQDFNFNRRHPNIKQLENLEEQKAILRYQKTEEVNHKIASLGNFIRMVDYTILETLSRSCVDCWKSAEHNVKQEGSSIFQVEVLFDDNGAVTFQPNLEQLTTGITNSLQNSIDTLSNLPRILTQPKLRVIIENSGVTINELFQKGPVFESFTKKENILTIIQERIISTLNKSYNDAFKYAQSLACFYPIYKRGKTWNPNDYLSTREGKPFTGVITDAITDDAYDQFLVDYMKQPIIDFNKAKTDIQTFIKEEYDLGNLRQGIVKGVLHIDLKTFRQALSPIPVKAKIDLIDLITKLANMKNKQVDNALTYYGKVLKMEPQTLENFVSFCEVFKRAKDVKEAIKEEIKFVDDTNTLFDSIPNMQTRTRNQLHSKYGNYENDLLTAESIRKTVIDQFAEKLKEIIQSLETKLNRYHEKASAIPLSLSLVDTEKEVPRAKKILRKVRALEDKVKETIKYQEIIGVDLNKFAFYSNVINVAEFALELYTSVQSWQEISHQATNIPFISLDMKAFREEVINLDHNVKQMQANTALTNYPILNELALKVGDYAPYIEELEVLSNSKMQTRHWNTLLESCNQPGVFNPKMTTEELLKLNILSQREKIIKMTNLSNGEHKLSEEFSAITNYWNKVQMPIMETEKSLNEDNLLLGPTDNLLAEINDALITISEMLQRPYVQGIRDTVTSLASTLENINQIIEAWQLFQSNWVLLSVIFSKESTRSLLPQQANKFTGVQRKWSTIARHAIKDTRLFSVCGFPQLLDVLHENNQTMESIITSLGKLIDSKRQAVPRLYFLSNDDVLRLISTTSTKDINMTASKILMNAKEFHWGKDDAELNALEGAKIHGIIGENNSELVLNKPVDLSAATEVWLQALLEQMHETMKSKLLKCIRNMGTNTFQNILRKHNPYIVFIIINTELSTLIYKSLKGTWCEKNPLDVINEWISNLTEIISENEEFSSLLVNLISHRDRYTALMKTMTKRKGIDLALEYETMHRTIRDGDNFYTQIGISKLELGYEFWGVCPNLVFTPDVDFAFQSTARNNRELKQSILVSSPMNGKETLIRAYAASCSKFLYTWYPFSDNSEYFMSRILIGCSLTGSWCTFLHIEEMKHRHLCYLFDNINNLYQLLNAGINRITISSKIIELNQSTRVFLTETLSSVHGTSSLPATMRSSFRKICIGDPAIEQIATIELMAMNFKDPEKTGIKLGAFIKHYSESISTVTRVPFIFAARNIVETAYQLRRLKEDDELLLMYSIFNYYSVSKTPNEREVIITLLKSVFQPPYENLYEKILGVENNMNRERIIYYLKKETEEYDKELPIDYIADKAYDLLIKIITTECIAIVGSPCSGKSTIVKIVKNLLSNEEFKKEFPKARLFEIYDCYNQADVDKRIYGHIFDDLTYGQTWAYGQLQAILHQMMLKENYITAIRFDGHLSPNFCLFLNNFLPGRDSCAFHTSSQDVYPTSHRMRVIIETPSLEGANPSLLSKCSLIFMKSIQNPKDILTSCGLVNPLIPLHRAFTNIITDTNLDYTLFRETFVNLMPKVVKRCFHSNNKILYSQENSRMDFGNVYLFDTLPYSTAILALLIIKDTHIDLSDQSQIDMVFAIAINRIYSTFLIDKEKESFNNWVMEQLDISLPSDWIGYSVPDAFWDLYPKPCIESMRIVDKKLEPLNYKLLDTNPIYQPRGEGKLPIFPNEVFITNVQNLMPLEAVNLLLSNGQSVVLHGPQSSGKYSFLQVVFNNNDTFLPIYMDANDFTSAEHFISFLMAHTPFISKILTATTMNKILVLVVSNICAKHVKLQEFLRSIIETGKINAFAINDPKVYETLTLIKFVTVVTTDEIEKLNIRFIKYYVPIGIEPLKKSTAQYIAKKTMKAYGYSDKITDFIVNFGSNVLEQFDIQNKPLQLLQCLFFIIHTKDDEDSARVVKLFLYEFFFRFIHKVPMEDVKDKIEFIANHECTTPEQKNAALDFINPDADIMIPISHLSKDMKQFNVEIKFANKKAAENRLARDIAVFNANSIEKVSIRVTPAVVRTWAMIFRALKAPGTNIIINGLPASGKYSLTRVVAHTCEYDFVNVAQPTAEELIVKEDRMFSLKTVAREVITNAVLHQKRTVIFVKATPGTMGEVSILLQFIKSCDFTPFFTKSTLEDLYLRFTNIHSLSFEQRIVAMRQIKNIIRLNIRIVISVTDSNTVTDYPINFVEIKVNHDTEESYTEFAQTVIEQSATKKFIQSTNQHISKVLGKVCTLAKKYASVVHPNMMHDFIDSFCHFAATDYQNIIARNESIQSALSFVAKLEIESRTIDRKLDSLAPTLQRLQTDSESLQSSYTTRKEAIDNRQEKLMEEKNAKLKEVEMLHDEVHDFEEQFKDLEPKLAKSIQEVKDLDQNEIDTIRISATEPTDSMKHLFEIFCLLLELPPSYERGGQKLLLDPKFISIITDGITIDKIQYKTLETVKPMFNNNTLNPSELEATAPALLVLYNWITTTYSYATLKIKLQSQKRILSEKEKTFKQYDEEMDVELASIEQVSTSLESELKNLQASIHSREQMEKDYKAIEERKRILDSLFKDIDQFTEKWQNDARDFTSRKEKLIGNSIVFAFYLVFSGVIRIDGRLEAYNALLDRIHTSGIESTEEDIEKLIRMRFISLRPEFYFDRIDTVHDLNIASDIHHLFATLRTPLLVDCDGMASEIVIKELKGKMLKVSAYSSTVEHVAAQAVAEGKTLIIFDVMQMIPILSTLISLDCLQQDQVMSKEVRIGGKVVLWDPNFRLFLLSPATSIKKLPLDLIARTTPIDITSTMNKETKYLFRAQFAQYFHPESLKKMLDLRQTEIMKDVNMTQMENNILDILADIVSTQNANSNYDYLADTDTINELLKAKEDYFKNKAIVIDSSPKDEYRNSMNHFNSFVKICTTFWNAATRVIPKITNQPLSVALSKYMRSVTSIFVNEGYHPGIILPEQQIALRESIVEVSFQTFLPTMPFNYGVFFLFYISFIYKMTITHTTINDLKPVLSHIRSAINSKIDYQDLYDKYDSFEKLRYTSFENFFQCVVQYISETFGSDFINNFPELTTEKILGKNSSTPSIIITSEQSNPTYLIHHVIRQRGRIENTESISFCEDLEFLKNTKKVITIATSRGNWICAHVTKLFPAITSIMSDIFTTMTTSANNTNFRLIVISSDINAVTPSFMTKARTIVSTSSLSVKSMMQQTINNYASQLVTGKYQRLLKKLVYAVASLIAFINYRNCIYPNGYNNQVYIPLDFITSICQRANEVFIDDEDHEPIENIRSAVMAIIFQSVINKRDKTMIKQIIKRIIRQETFQDGFKVGVGPEAEEGLWTMPDDSVPIPSFGPYFQKMPPFPIVETLGIDRLNRSLKDLTISKIIAQPFIKFAGLPTVPIQGFIRKIEDFIAILPKKIIINNYEFKGFYFNNAYSGIIDLNNAIEVVGSDLDKILDELNKGNFTESAKVIMLGKTPTAWKDAAHVYTLIDPRKFINHLISEGKEFKRLIKLFDNTIKAGLVNNLQAYLATFKMQESIRTGIPLIDLQMKTILCEEDVKEAGEGEFIIKGLAMLLCVYKDGKLFRADKEQTSPFIPLPAIKVVFEKKSEDYPTKTMIKIPLFTEARIADIDVSSSVTREIINDESIRNHVCNIYIETEDNPSYFTLNESAIYCRVSEQLM